MSDPETVLLDGINEEFMVFKKEGNAFFVAKQLD